MERTGGSVPEKQAWTDASLPRTRWRRSCVQTADRREAAWAEAVRPADAG
jgi:hypothetical protein